MGTALVKLKIMPEAPDTDLESIQAKVQETIKSDIDSDIKFEQEEIAFGLKAVIAGFAIDESKEIDPIQDKVKGIEGVKSAEVADFRRAFG